METEIRALIPNIDPIVSEYSVGYLTHASTAWTGDDDEEGTGSGGAGGSSAPLADAAVAVTELLLSASGEMNNAAVRERISKLVSKWVEKYAGVAAGPGGAGTGVSSAVRRLDQTIQVSAQRNMSSTLAVTMGGVDLESANTRKVESKVDKKKLEKAERKIAAKQNKKTFKTVEYEASRLLNQPDAAQSYEEFYMAVNPLQLGNSAAGKPKDIKLDNIDVNIAGTRILTDTNLSLSYGHRYGLVGNNGVGKSTLLRALSRRELPVPTHISILHVEQEITGDDTSALQAVLDADVWRKFLLKEQGVSVSQLATKEKKRITTDKEKEKKKIERKKTKKKGRKLTLI